MDMNQEIRKNYALYVYKKTISDSVATFNKLNYNIFN